MQGGNAKTIFLHIGVHKTGTTAIQVLFSQARADLAERGILYPWIGCARGQESWHGHHELPWLMVGRSVSSRTLFADLRAEIQNSSADTVVLSSEEFDQLDDEQSLSFVRALPGHKKVVFYYRRQADVLQGLYGTEICFNREARPIVEFIETVPSELNYLKLARRWAKAVGTENVIARAYDRSGFANGNVAADFCSAISVMLPQSSFARRTEWNESLPDFAALSVQRLWDLDVPEQTIHRVIYALQTAFHGTKYRYQFLPPSQRRAIDARFGRDNETFLREFAPGQRDVFGVEETQSDEAWREERERPNWALDATLMEAAEAFLAKLRQSSKVARREGPNVVC